MALETVTYYIFIICVLTGIIYRMNKTGISVFLFVFNSSLYTQTLTLVLKTQCIS